MLGEGVSYPGSFREGTNILSPLFPLTPPPHMTWGFLDPWQTFPNGYISLWKKGVPIGAARVDGILPWGLLFSRIYFQGLTTTHATSVGWTDRKWRLLIWHVLGAGQTGMQLFQAAIFPSDHALGTWRGYTHYLRFHKSFFPCSKEQQKHKWYLTYSLCYMETLESGQGPGPNCKSLTFQLLLGSLYRVCWRLNHHL